MCYLPDVSCCSTSRELVTIFIISGESVCLSLVRLLPPPPPLLFSFKHTPAATLHRCLCVFELGLKIRMDNIMTKQIKQNERTEQRLIQKFCSSENMHSKKEEKEQAGLISFRSLFQACRALTLSSLVFRLRLWITNRPLLEDFNLHSDSSKLSNSMK